MNIKKIKNTYANILTSMRDCLSSCMQGRQNLVPKMFYQVNIDIPVPEDNFYRKLNLFKIFLVGYQNNINSDSAFIKANASMDSLVEKEIIEQCLC